MSDLPLYKNPEAPIKERVADLVSRMTPEEKVNQMVLGGDPWELAKQINEGNLPEFGPSSVYVQSAPIAELNTIQKHIMENTRLGIPMLVAGESIHGLMCPGATMFPQGIGLGAMFNKDLVRSMADTIGREAESVGIRQTYAPNLDISRDPRWGRTEENYGEDPYLTSTYAVEYVTKVQEHGVACSPKHYLGYGSPEGGLNIAPAHMGEREMRETTLQPFKAAVSKGHALSLMPSYGEIDGCPVHGSRHLLTDILRGECGFEGFTISDYSAVTMLYSLHRVAHNPLEAGKMALHAGLDFEAPSPDGFGPDFLAALKKGEVSMEEVDLAVSRILYVKFKLGLFENPYIKDNGTAFLHTEEDVKKALAAAEESIVLLKNDGILPLDGNKIKKIAVVGPNSDVVQLGDYTPPHATENAITFRRALTERFGEDKVAYARGTGIVAADEGEIEAAAAIAKDADVCFVVLGDNSNFFGGIGWGDDGVGKAVTCGEGFDLTELVLPESQRKLLKAVAQTGTPVVLILETGRPYCITEESDISNAVLEAWYPGEQGGVALCNIVFGDVSPSGRLPITFPRSTGQIPCFYNHKTSARGYYHRPGSPEAPGRDYVFDTPAPLYGFGHGLSYTDFEYSDLKVDTNADEGTAKVTVTVTNTGKMQSKHSVLLFLTDVVCRITAPVRRLRGFEKIELDAGESRELKFSLGFEDFCFINEKMEDEIEHGDYVAQIGDKTAWFRL